MYLRITERRNRDGSAVAYYALAENVWNAQAKRSEAQVIHNFGRADQLDKAALQRLIASIQRVIDADATGALPTSGKTSLPDIEIDAVFALGVVLAARALWEELGIGEAIRSRLAQAHLSAPHEMALFAMAAQRLDEPGSKLSCATRWLPDIAWLPEADKLAVDQLYRALDFLAVWSDEIERDVFLRSADLLRLDVDLIFYDTTTAYFEIDEPDEHCELWGGKLFAPPRQWGHNKEGRDNQPQVIIAMAVTRDGMPVRSWVLPGNTADVATVARIKQDLHAWRLGRCLFVGDAGMYSADNLVELSRGLGRYVLAVPMRRVKDVETEVLTRPGRYRKVADNLPVKEVWVGDGERRKRYVLCFNPAEAEQQRAHCAQVLTELTAELRLLDERNEDHPKAACALMASRRYGRYLSADQHGRPKLDTAKVKAAEKFDGNTGDPTTLAPQIEKLKQRFGLTHVVLVGDRGLITEARITADVKTAGLDWISALRGPAIKDLLNNEAIQPGLFDQRDMAAITSPDYPGERLIVCRNPDLAAERARKREELLTATETDLAAIQARVERKRDPLRGTAEIALAVGAVLNTHNMKKHFDLEITDAAFRFTRKTEAIAAEAATDGLYVVRTSLAEATLGDVDTVRSYKSLALVERAFRCIKTVDLHVRPVYHWLADRVRAHVFLCMLDYYLEWHMRQRLAPMLFDDTDKEAAETLRSSVVAQAQRSPAAMTKQTTGSTPDGLPVHSFRSLLADLATVARNTLTTAITPLYPLTVLTKPTIIQQKAFDLLGIAV